MLNKALPPAGRLSLRARAVETEGQQQQEGLQKQDNGSAARQLLGMKGAGEETDKFKIRVQLTKPVTWVPLIWGASLGAAERCRAFLSHVCY